MPRGDVRSYGSRDRLALLVILGSAAGFAAWSIWLIVSPGGSPLLEYVQLAGSIIAIGYSAWAYRKNDPRHNRRARFVLLAFAVLGALVVLGLAGDQRSSRTWARLGWAAFVVGYLGAVVVWWQFRQHRMATLVFAVVGLFLLIAGAGLTLNCDQTVQRTWCDPNYEREQAIAESVEVEGQFERSGRAGGPQSAAVVSYFIPDGAAITDVTDPPGEWSYEEQPLQSIEVQRGRFTSVEEGMSDCRLDVKVEAVPAGNRQTILVNCGLES